MANVSMLKEKIIERNMTMEQLAEQIGVNRSTIYRKIAKNGDVFTLHEAKEISRVLGLSCDEVMSIFFTQYVA